MMLSKNELSLTLINLICAKFLLSYPRQMVQNSASASWIEMLYVTGLMLFIFFVTTHIYKSKKNIIELAQMKFGKIGRIIVGIICFLILLFNFVSVLRIYSESVKIILLPDTDLDLILIVFILTCAVCAYLGLKSISRLSYILIPVCTVIFVLFLLLLISDYNSQNIAPLFGNGAKSIFVDGINSLYAFSDILALNLLLPYADNVDDARKSGYRAIIISGIVGIMICLAYNLIFPYPTSEEFIMPVYQLARFINTSSFFNRFEAFFHFAWSILIMLYGSAYIYILCYTFQITFSFKYLKPLIYSVSLICAFCSLISESIIDFMHSSHSMEIWVYPAALLLPIFFGFIEKKKFRK